ncbi:hypothetical protein C4579_01010 [Candidatus Microgenomates bacterium]|nr:MAG: hypothetical protein C4579_01010 [Candidatus Microgenomates bacterium]
MGIEGNFMKKIERPPSELLVPKPVKKYKQTEIDQLVLDLKKTLDDLSIVFNPPGTLSPEEWAQRHNMLSEYVERRNLQHNNLPNSHPTRFDKFLAETNHLMRALLILRVDIQDFVQLVEEQERRLGSSTNT